MIKTALTLSALLLSLAGASGPALAITYGDQDVLGTGIYGSDPSAGATLQGLLPGAVTFATFAFGHSFPFSPAGGEFAGTDQIYTGGSQTNTGDGYSSSAGRLATAQSFTLDYSSAVAPGNAVTTLTLGIAADDFQRPVFGQSFVASINGTPHAALSNVLNGLDQTGPQVQFFTIGLAPSVLSPNHVLTLSIDQAGDGRDGWAVDFVTVGVTVTPVPEPASALMLGAGALLVWGQVRRRRPRG